jgi:glyceraldehyde 3-phosphate dehydrogenase
MMTQANPRPLRIAINGFGRIGRCVLRALHGRKAAGASELPQIVAINDLGSPETMAHLLSYDSVHRRFDAEVRVEGGKLLVDDEAIVLVSEPDPNALPWEELEVDLVLECTGRFVDAESAAAHIRAGAKRVVISAPAKGEAKTLVFGVNHEDFDPATDAVVSNGSCTTNCLAPIAKVLLDTFGIEGGLMTTIHSYTNDQRVLDLPHAKGDLRRARAAAQNMIPTSTGAAKAVAKVLPELEGKFDGMAVRVPTMDVSLVDLSIVTEKPVDEAVLNAAMQAAADGPLKGVLEVAKAPLVSSDYIGNPASSVYDPSLTRVQGEKLVKILAWYDNEGGFANRMIDLSHYVGATR